MPQAVFERKSPNHPLQNNWVPELWAYIGQTVTSNAADTTPPIAWAKVNVYNRAGNNWVLLNADLDKVDYGLVNLSYNKVMLDIHDHLNWDFLDYTLTVTPKPTTWATTSITFTVPMSSYQRRTVPLGPM